MNFYTVNGSPNCRKVHAVINYLKLDVQINELDIFAGELATPEFHSLNPNGMVPVIQEGQFLLWESNAIMQYLAAKVPESSFYPGEPQLRADIHRWQFWEQNHFNRATGALVFENMLKCIFKIGEADTEKVAAATEDFHKYATVLDTHLEKKDFILGSKLSLADFSVAGFSEYFDTAKVPFRKYPNLVAWLERLDAIPAWADTPSLAA